MPLKRHVDALKTQQEELEKELESLKMSSTQDTALNEKYTKQILEKQKSKINSILGTPWDVRNLEQVGEDRKKVTRTLEELGIDRLCKQCKHSKEELGLRRNKNHIYTSHDYLCLINHEYTKMYYCSKFEYENKD